MELESLRVVWGLWGSGFRSEELLPSLFGECRAADMIGGDAEIPQTLAQSQH